MFAMNHSLLNCRCSPSVARKTSLPASSIVFRPNWSWNTRTSMIRHGGRVNSDIWINSMTELALKTRRCSHWLNAEVTNFENLTCVLKIATSTYSRTLLPLLKYLFTSHFTQSWIKLDLKTTRCREFTLCRDFQNMIKLRRLEVHNKMCEKHAG